MYCSVQHICYCPVESSCNDIMLFLLFSSQHHNPQLYELYEVINYLSLVSVFHLMINTYLLDLKTVLLSNVSLDCY